MRRRQEQTAGGFSIEASTALLGLSMKLLPPLLKTLRVAWYPVKTHRVKPARIKVPFATPLAPFFLDERALPNRLSASALTALDALIDSVDRAAKKIMLEPDRKLEKFLRSKFFDKGMLKGREPIIKHLCKVHPA